MIYLIKSFIKKVFSFLHKKGTQPKPPTDFATPGALTPEQLGVYAEQALKNPVIKAALQEIEKRLYGDFRNTLDDEVDKREIAFSRLKAVDYLRQVLLGYVNQALVEKKLKENKEKEKEENARS